MSVYGRTAGSRATAMAAPPFWICVLLGLFLVLAGVFVLADVALATVISSMLIGAVAIAAGAFEIAHAIWTKGWGGIVWQLILGSLYVAFGLAMVTQPVASAFILTYALSILFVLSGVVRILLGLSHWQQAGWIMLVSGLFGVGAGLVVLTGLPSSGLWVLGFVLGIDLMTHGMAWLGFAWHPASR
jgi:uncharacterized membrane protein HdeD (DUF308 family)